jgi:hypothetical protein
MEIDQQYILLHRLSLLDHHQLINIVCGQCWLHYSHKWFQTICIKSQVLTFYTHILKKSFLYSNELRAWKGIRGWKKDPKQGENKIALWKTLVSRSFFLSPNLWAHGFSGSSSVARQQWWQSPSETWGGPHVMIRFWARTLSFFTHNLNEWMKERPISLINLLQCILGFCYKSGITQLVAAMRFQLGDEPEICCLQHIAKCHLLPCSFKHWYNTIPATSSNNWW